jgi:hypothetical protein
MQSPGGKAFKKKKSKDTYSATVQVKFPGIGVLTEFLKKRERKSGAPPDTNQPFREAIFQVTKEAWEDGVSELTTQVVAGPCGSKESSACLLVTDLLARRGLLRLGV